MRIVVCDDDRLLLEALSRALEIKGFTVEATASTSREAVDAVERLELANHDTLVDSVTITDPDTLTRSLTMRLVFHRMPVGTQLDQPICHRQEEARHG